MAKLKVSYLTEVKKEIELPEKHVLFWKDDESLYNLPREEYEKLEDDAWDFVYKACPDATNLYADSIDILDLIEE